ncbi:hypothetical protein PG994_014483 [Apiospora phragmitis]|uniref:Uncharacterized protein n=1 Tax=Apiospora phragmitis TaxID=2905665 RepID=A0ABR1T4F6_9PEZI
MAQEWANQSIHRLVTALGASPFENDSTIRELWTGVIRSYQKQAGLRELQSVWDSRIEDDENDPLATPFAIWTFQQGILSDDLIMALEVEFGNDEVNIYHQIEPEVTQDLAR